MPIPSPVIDTLREDREFRSTPGVLRDLVRYATLAASSHNSQPWKFSLSPHSISVLPDFSRRCPVADPDDHHLFVSLGCATENLAHAALAGGLYAHAYVDRNRDGGVDVLLEPTRSLRTRLFDAIPDRQCTRMRYDSQPISANDLADLFAAGQGDGVRMLLLTERTRIEAVLEYVTAANTRLLADPAFVRELKAWMRFSEKEARRTGDGLYISRAARIPDVPHWLGSLLVGAFLRPAAENDRYVEQVRSSTGLAIFVSDKDDKAHWVEAGRCYERFALQATALGVRNAFLNQAVEVADIRAQFAQWLGIGTQRPDLIVRFGRGPRGAHSFRRPVHEVLLRECQHEGKGFI